jgi:hypothetical protein
MLFTSLQPIHKQGGTGEHSEHYPTECPAFQLCNPLLPFKRLPVFGRQTLVPFSPGAGRRGPIYMRYLTQHYSHDQLNKKQDDQRFLHDSGCRRTQKLSGGGPLSHKCKREAPHAVRWSDLVRP